MTQNQRADQAAVVQGSGTLALHVDDMTCGHCAGAIKKAVESGIPGSRVVADPSTKLVLVTGATDFAQVQKLVRSAGYTPEQLNPA